MISPVHFIAHTETALVSRTYRLTFLQSTQRKAEVVLLSDITKNNEVKWMEGEGLMCNDILLI